MSVSYYKHRLLNHKEINAERKVREEEIRLEQEAWILMFDKHKRYQDLDDERVGQRGGFSSTVSLERSMERIARVEAEVYADRGISVAEIGDWLLAINTDERYKALKEQYIEPEEISRTEILRNNELYITFGQQLFVRHKGELYINPRGIRSFATWSLYIAALATLNIMTEHVGGYEMLRELHPPELPMPTRESCWEFRYEYDMLPVDTEKDPFLEEANQKFYPDTVHPVEWLARMISEIPNLLILCETVLLTYSESVRLERDAAFFIGERCYDGPLPDDPSEGIAMLRLLDNWPFDTRMKNAIQAYRDDEGTLKEVARKYNVPRNQLHEKLKEMGLSGQRRGGNRRKGAA